MVDSSDDIPRPEDFDTLPDPLHEAVRTGTLDEVRPVVESRSGFLNGRDHSHDFTALELAIALGKLDLAALLLDHGADPNCPSANDSSALASAAALPPRLALQAIKMLHARGARLRIPDPAIRVAGLCGNLSILERLLDVPAGFHDGDERADRVELDERACRELLDESELSAAFGLLLAGAARRGDIATMESALARTPTLANRREHLAWAFDEAAAARQRQAWDWLLRLGVPDKASALKAAIRGYLETPGASGEEMIRAVLSLDGPNVASSMLFSTTHAEALMRLALEHHADVNASSERGVTPLMFAAQHHQIDQIQRLIVAGADPKREDDDGNNARSYAALWPLSVHAAATDAFLAELGVPKRSYRGPVPHGVVGTVTEAAPNTCTEGWAVAIGCAIALVIVAGAILFDWLGVL